MPFLSFANFLSYGLFYKNNTDLEKMLTPLKNQFLKIKTDWREHSTIAKMQLLKNFTEARYEF